MACKHTPDLVEKRRKMRFRSGVRAFLAAGAVLLALFLLYTAARSILVSVSQQRWKKNISSAIRSGDTTQIAFLLEKCRKEAPYLAEKPIFKQWEKSLLQLMNEEASRRQEFRKRLNALQQKLQNHPDADFAWQSELTAIAGYAANKQELAELRKLEEHCKALTQLRTVKAAQSAVGEIKELEKSLQTLSELTRQNRWQEHRRQQRKIREKISAIMLKYPSIPEISLRALQIKKLLEQDVAAAAKAENHAAAEQAGYRKIISSASPEELASAIEAFRKQYPQSRYNAELNDLYNDLKQLQLPYADQLKNLLQKMADNNRTAKYIYTQEFEKIAAEELQFGTFELILQQDNHRIVRFETLSKCEFIRQSNGSSTITFTDLNNHKVQGVFSADGSGVVESNGERRYGRMIYGKSTGMLPQSFKQQTLLKIQRYLQQNKEEDFPVFLFFLQQEISSGKLNLLPMAIKEKLQNALSMAEKILKAPAAQFIFTKDILKQCSENTPVFAGIVKLNGKTPEFATPSIAINKNKNTTLWLVNSRQKPYFFELGSIKNNAIVSSRKPLPVNRKYAVAAVPAKGMDYAMQKSVWEKTARENNLKLPPMPAFLP